MSHCRRLFSNRKPSPDAVACVDLTLSSDSEEETPDQKRRLGAVRRELEPPSAKKRKGGLKTTGLDDNDDDRDVIVLDMSTDDDISTNEEMMPAAADIAHRDNTMFKAEKVEATNRETRPTKKAKVKIEGKSSSHNKAPNSLATDGIEVVEPAPPKVAAATMVPESSTTDDDVVVEGVVNETRLPHLREHCTLHPFTGPKLGPKLGHCRYKQIIINADAYVTDPTHCDLCYCYVCDCPAKDCRKWLIDDRLSESHCFASERCPQYRKMREHAKLRKEAIENGVEVPPQGYHFTKDCYRRHNCPKCWCFICQIPSKKCTWYSHINADPKQEKYQEMLRLKKLSTLSTYGKPGPFPPDNQDAKLDPKLTKCMHCSWYSKLHDHDSWKDDFCHNCGRVASAEALGRNQRPSLTKKAAPFQIPFSTTKAAANKQTFCLGQKEIPFRIEAYDPRLLAKFVGWNQNPSMPYDQTNHEVEIFQHRIGNAPTVESIRYSLSASWEKPLEETSPAFFVDDPKHRNLLVLATAKGGGFSAKHEALEIDASWDEESRTGKFVVRLMIPKRLFFGKPKVEDPNGWIGKLPLILGLWFDVLPLNISEIMTPLKVQTPASILAAFKYEEINSETEKEIKRYYNEVMKAKEENEERLSLTQSSGSSYRGSVSAYSCPGSLRDSLVRYFYEVMKGREIFIYDYKYCVEHMSLVDAVKDLNDCRNGSIQRRHTPSFDFDAIVGHRDSLLFNIFYKEHHQKISPACNIYQVMEELENLGHESEDYIDGLNVELLEFQRQSLKWAIERENVPDGVQSFHWAKIPRLGIKKKEIYYNPVLNQFRRDKPAVIRGGYLAEQMGLGKTIISLALILKNPAPQFPESGSAFANLTKNKTQGTTSTDSSGGDIGWDTDLYAKTSSKTNPELGSILCRGTLVICPVSLVGQWIEEAKSKLKDPGLVYPYHGQNRKRDALQLAKNSIVVTTYNVLSSDATYHAKKAGPGYCPPLAQIRWWRIICDEGHCLRNVTASSKAVMELQADHKWIVSGTPISTQVNELKNQLKFLGFDSIDDKFFERGDRRTRCLDAKALMYFLRPIMMRHSQQQKYRGTSTTLMSLPPKTEKTDLVKFTAKEKSAYEKIDKAAREWYLDFRSENHNNLSSHFLKISSKLSPLRIACSGGRCLIPTDHGFTENNEAMNYDFVFTSKLERLLTYLKNIRDKEPKSKSLVFSQFTSTLDWLKANLPRHGFQFRTLSGDMTMAKRAKALSDFQKDPPTTIFLLSMRAGAVGINLTQANRVFLMEPSFNPALEAQAIGRIHRLGQKRPVEIVRLVMKDSFEERMVNFLDGKYGKRAKTDISEDSKAAVPSSVQGASVGNLKSDKVELVTEEFDSLFGVDELAEAVKEAEKAKKAKSPKGTHISDKDNTARMPCDFKDDEMTSTRDI